MSTFEHDKDAVLDYAFDWSRWLSEGEIILSHSVQITGGTAVVDGTSEVDAKVTAWISGAQVGNVHLTCRVVTNEGRTDDRTIMLQVQER